MSYTSKEISIDGYVYESSTQNESHGYLVPALEYFFDKYGPKDKSERIFDLGCGNGSVANHFHQRGYNIIGVDPSVEGIQHANKAYSFLNLRNGSAYDDLAHEYGKFKFLYSLEVVEHVYAPRDYARTIKSLLATDGVAIISTPYHSYLKNLALAITGKMDAHFTALWDHGHIKFWSIATLTELLNEVDLQVVEIKRIGRTPVLAKSMMFAVTHSNKLS
ncbi:class I SAM-dependent methyltransferase [Oceanicaulis sp.]|uniref:class I SAM-dependent methyltransferase n=1 Tax=Oceanicaulis sp. TaxID=1924941 RepID=UPI003BA8C0AD